MQSPMIKNNTRYLIERSVESASGSQIFYVDATSDEEAIAKHKKGEGGIYANECEVTSLGVPSISGQTNTNDYGDYADQADLHISFNAVEQWLGSINPDIQELFKKEFQL